MTSCEDHQPLYNGPCKTCGHPVPQARTLEDQARAWRIAYDAVRAKGYQGLGDALEALSAQQGVMPEGFGPLSELVAQQGGEEGECCPHGYLFAETCPHCGGQIDDAENAVREIAAQAFIAGATAVHDDWTANPGPAPRGDPEFGESAGEYAQSIDLSDFSAQQAAGEAEKLAEEYMMDIEDYSIFDSMDNQEQAAAAFRWLLSRATPQPTETQRIVAWLRAQSDADDFGCGPGVPEVLSYAAWRIENGEHLAGDKV